MRIRRARAEEGALLMTSQDTITRGVRSVDWKRRMCAFLFVLAVAATAVVALPIQAKAADAPTKTVRIGFPSSGNNFASGLLGVAETKGYLDEYLEPLGYKAEVTGFVGAAPAFHEALSSGDLDYVDYAGFARIVG